MKRPWFLLTLALALCVAAMAQTSADPFLDALARSQQASNDMGVAFLADRGRWNGYAAQIQQLQGQTANLPQDEASIGVLQQNVKDLNAANSSLANTISEMQKALTQAQVDIKNLQAGQAASPGPASIIFANMLDGPLNGSVQGAVDFGTSNWNITGGALVPAFSGRARSFALLGTHTLKSVTVYAVNPSLLPKLTLASPTGSCANLTLTATATAFSCTLSGAVSVTFPGGTDALQARFTEIDVQ